MSEGASEKPGKRLLATARRINRHPRLLERVRRTRERALGDEQLIDRLSTARGRPADLAAQQLVAFRGEEHGVLGELGLTAVQAWQRLAESQDRRRGKVEVAILFTDLVGFSSWALEAGDRAAIRLLREVAEAVEPPIAEQRGEMVKRLGHPRKLGGDYFGVDVNVAARLAEAAKPDEILVSDRALATLDPGRVESRKRRVSAKGAPKDLAAYAVIRRR